MNTKEWNQMQIKEALSDTNRYYFNQHFGCDAESDEDLMMYYACKGAEEFARKHQSERPNGQRKTSD